MDDHHQNPKDSNKFNLWLAFRKAIQYFFLALFLIALISTRTAQKMPNLGSIVMASDPYITLLHLLSSREFIAILSLSLIPLIFTLIIGRVWCGWMCPLGTILDLFPFRLSSRKSKYLPESLRKTKTIILWVALILALLSNLTLLILDPLTILFRTGTIVVLPIIDLFISSSEKLLYSVRFFSQPITAFDALIRPAVLPYEPVTYRSPLLYAFILAAIVLSNAISARFWCRYLCPLGALLGWISRISIFRRTVNNRCNRCGMCEAACPTGTISAVKNFSSDPAECTQCLECFKVCPHNAVTISSHSSPAASQDYDPGRRNVLISCLSAVGVIGLFKANSLSLHPHPHLIRPPGAVNNHLLSTCIRCGICMRVCPTGGLQPGLAEAGAEGMWTPVLIPEFGFCDYSCNACGSACPTGAIPLLPLDKKRIEVIGKAYIDENRCIAWSDHQDCIVCQEMCPVPEKAITLEQTGFINPGGEIVNILVPKVIRERCIGCGICEYKCPVNGEAAIRVFIANDMITS